MHSTPPISFSLFTMIFLLFSNAVTISFTDSCCPDNASTAAIWAMLVGFPVDWLCIDSIDFIISLFAPQNPILQPVMEYVFDREFTVIVRFLVSSFRDAALLF